MVNVKNLLAPFKIYFFTHPLRKHKQNIRKISSALLLLLSFTFIFNTAKESLHVLFEHDFAAEHACSTETEKDDCHLFIVHHVKSDNCNGEHDHFLKKDEKCFKCDYYKEKQSHFLQGDSTSFHPAKINNDLCLSDQHKLSFYSFHRFLRGPPPLA